MGVYDTLVDDDKSAQVKCWGNLSLKTFVIGDKTPLKKSCTILFPDYEGVKYAIIENGYFMGLTNDPTKAVPPYISKWGKRCKTLNDITEWNLLPQKLKLRDMI